MTRDADALDPREELAELAASVRAYVEWQADTGASGLPVETAPAAVLAALGTGSPPVARQGRDGAFANTAAPHPSGPLTMGETPNPPPGAPAQRAPVPAGRPPLAPAPDVPVAAPRAPGGASPPPAEPVTASPAQPTPKAPIPPAQVGPDERRTRLALLAEEVRSCTKCVLHQARRQTVFSRGDPFAELVFIGEGPGADEDAQGAPFVGAAGQLLDRMIAAMGYGRDDVYVANIVKCRPPNNRKPEADEMASCMPYLVQQLGLVKPRVIVALGATAMQGLCGTTEGITRMRGKWKLYKGSIPIMPTFHPAYLLRSPGAKREVWADLQEVMKHLGAPKPPRQG